MVLVGDRIRATKLSNDSFYQQVEGVAIGICDNRVLINADRVLDKNVNHWTNHLSCVATSANLKHVIVINEEVEPESTS